MSVHKARKARQKRGNMIALVSCVLGFVSVFMLAATSFGGLVFQQNRLRTTADEIALAGARALNAKDRIGQMNNMVARSRHLVFTSRKQYEDAQANYPQLNAMAYQQLEEARNGAILLEAQRKHLKDVASEEAKVAVLNKFNQIKSTYEMTLPWMKITNLKLNHRYLGKIDGVESNVEELKSVNDLTSHDNVFNYISNDPGLKLYAEGKNARLPGADSTLTFKISSLPAPVESTVAPARLALTDKFKGLGSSGQLPSAVQIQVTVDVATGLGLEGKSTMSATGTAAATGAGKQL